MPHKRNPITCERLCGLARVLRGNALAAMENVTLWHERDISHSSVERIILPDSTTLLDYMVVTLTDVVDKLLVYPQRMKDNLESSKGLIYSQSVLLALTKKGLTREKAYTLVQRNAMKARAGAKNFREFCCWTPMSCVISRGGKWRSCSTSTFTCARSITYSRRSASGNVSRVGFHFDFDSLSRWNLWRKRCMTGAKSTPHVVMNTTPLNSA
jgi:hypothetical protein